MTKQTTINKKKADKIQSIKDKYIDGVSFLLNKYFPKGNKKRGEAMVILVIAFMNGLNCQEEISKLK